MRKKQGIKSITAFLLSFLLLFQNNMAFAVSGTGGEDETEEEGRAGIVSENQISEREDIAEDTVSAQSLPEIQSGSEEPANPVHHCTKKSDDTDYTEFSYIYFGSYPQSQVSDSALIAAIDKKIEKYGAEAEAGVDVWVNGTKYRRISKADTNNDEFFDLDGYFEKVPPTNGYRYFKWERIRWKVLQNNGSSLFVVADIAIDGRNYSNKWNGPTWENSDIRNWLNSSFYNTAFNGDEKSAIIEQTVENADNPDYGTKGGNNTQDKIYLLSIDEAINEAYGFCSDRSATSSRRMEISDYATAMGGMKLVGNVTNWWLRSPGETSRLFTNYATVNSHGRLVISGTSCIEYLGICPAMHISLSSDNWLMTDDGTSGERGHEKAKAPSASISTGTSVIKNTKLALDSATKGADIYYTTDGSTPTEESALYTSKINIDHDMTVKAVALCRGYMESDVAEFSYEIGKSSNGNEEISVKPVHQCNKQDGTKDTATWSYVYFGSYPQSEVTDNAVKAAIDNAIEKYGTEAEAGTDVWVNGTKYRRISRFDTNYSGYFADMPASNGYRYFKWERIKWRILENDGGNTFLIIADRAVDCKFYNLKSQPITWERSSIRNWLNNDFYNTAFNRSEQDAIVEQTIKNQDNQEHGTEGGNNTKDKIYLPSISELTNEGYGFCSDWDTDSMSRRMEASDYAHARGTTNSDDGFEGKCRWWLRSPGSGKSNAAMVLSSGYIRRNGLSINNRSVGVCPVLQLNLSSVIWSMTDDETSGEGGSEKAAAPSASISAGSSVAKNTKLALSCSTKGADIYYTTDGTVPTVKSSLYTGEITIDRDMTVKAVAMCKGYSPSNVAEFSYKLQGSGSLKVQKLTIKAPSKKLAAGKKVKLTLNVTPQNAANKAVKWNTSNKKYATVDKNGKVTLKKKGIGKNVTITATAQDGSGKKASLKIKIMRHAVKSIKLTAPKKTLKAGKVMTIKAAVKTTGNNANKTLAWKSSNKKYATVSNKGKVTAKKAGKGKTVTITATATDGSNKKAKIKIKIK